MSAFGALVRKDLVVFLQDPRAMIMSFVAPIVIGSFFGYVMGGIGSKKDPAPLDLIAVDQENGPAAKAIVERLKSDPALKVRAATLEVAREDVRKGAAPVAVVIPPGFGKQATLALFGGGPRPKLNFLYDPSHQMEAMMAKGILTGQVMQVISREAFTGQSGRESLEQARAVMRMGTGISPDVKRALGKVIEGAEEYSALSKGSDGSLAGGMQVPFDTAEEALTARVGVEYNAYAHAFGGMSIQFLLFMGIETGVGLLLLQQRGLWKRFRAAPLSRLTLLGSRTVSATLIGMAILAVVFTFARIVFDVRIEGSWLGFLGVCVAFSIFTATYGLLIAAIGRTPEATRGLSILTTLVLLMLSGAWVPSFLFPAWLQSFTKVLPTRWAMDGLDAMTWKGLPLADGLTAIGVLLLFSAALGVVAVWRFRWSAVR